MINRPHTRPEINEILDFIHDYLNEEQLFHVQEVDADDPNLWICMARDKDDYLNGGIIGWDKTKDQIVFYAFDPLRAFHDDEEGVTPQDSRCFWDADNVNVFILHLIGEARQIVAKERKLKVEKNT